MKFQIYWLTINKCFSSLRFKTSHFKVQNPKQKLKKFKIFLSYIILGFFVFLVTFPLSTFLKQERKSLTQHEQYICGVKFPVSLPVLLYNRMVHRVLLKLRASPIQNQERKRATMLSVQWNKFILSWLLAMIKNVERERGDVLIGEYILSGQNHNYMYETLSNAKN